MQDFTIDYNVDELNFEGCQVISAIEGGRIPQSAARGEDTSPLY